VFAIRLVLTAAALFLVEAGQVLAADNADAQALNVTAQPQFDGKIDTWVEGSIVSLDAPGGKFSVRGAKRPYATAYAQMTKEIYDKTRDLQGAAREAKENEIRNAWRDKLNKAQREPNERDGDFTFHLPERTMLITALDESRHYGKDYDVSALPAGPMTDKHAAALIALKNLRAGEHVVVGYAKGVIKNDAYVVLKANYADLMDAPTATAAGSSETISGRSNVVPSPDHSEKPIKPDNTAVNKRDRDATEVTADQQKQNKPDLEVTREIRRAVVKDDTLSTYAHNVKIITKDGNVTLKGPVNSNEEKANIERKALDIAGQGHVVDQIEVLP
jgi:hyperosmotically inducible protein